MNRGGPLERRTPLESKTRLRRTTALVSNPKARSALHAESAARRLEPKRRTARPARNTGPSATVRAQVAARSGGWCEWLGCVLVATDVHHRLNRKQGGRRGEMAARINQPAWLLHACRLHHRAVTSPHGEGLEVARSSGWLLREGDDARTVPVVSRHGRVWLTDAGTVLAAPPTVEGRNR